MASRFRTSKALYVALLGAMLTIVVVLFLGRQFAQRKAESSIIEKVTARGWGVTLESPRVGLTGNVHLPSICISLADDDHDDLCVENLTLNLHLWALIQKRIRVQDLHAERVRVDSTQARLSDVQRAGDDDESAPDAAASGRMPAIRRAGVDQIDIRLQRDDNVLDLRLENAALTPDEDLLVLEAVGRVNGFTGDNTVLKEGGLKQGGLKQGGLKQGVPKQGVPKQGVLEQALGALVDRPFDITARGNLDVGLEHAGIAFHDRLQAELPLRDRLSIGLDGVTFDAPYAVRVHAPHLAIDAREVSARADWIEAKVGVWTTRLPSFYLSSFNAESPNVAMPRDQVRPMLGRLADILNGRNTARRTPDAPTDAADPDTADNAPSPSTQGSNAPQNDTANDTANGATTDTQSDPSNDATRTANTDAADANPSNGVRALLKRLTDEREWWEILPRAITFNNGQVRFTGENTDDSMLIEDISVAYAVRVLNQQMDLEFAARLTDQDTDLGAFDGRFEWNYTKKVGRAYWEVERLALSSVSSLVGALPAKTLSGVFDSEGRLRFDAKKRVTGAHKTTLRDLHLAHPRLRAPLQIAQFSIAGDIDHGELEEEGPPSVIFRQQALALEDSRATLDLAFHDVALFTRPRTSRIHIDLEVPDQPAMQLFESVPESILGPLKDTEMTGTWGMRLAFDIEHVGMTQNDTPLWQIATPSVYDVRDRTLSLVSLPEEVDVRRLNRAMRFVFRGPDDEFMRPIRIPSPEAVTAMQRASDNEEANAAHNNEPSSASTTRGSDEKHAWIPLRNMSYYFVATQLYREDGSFFRNSGINWLQIRRVLSDALTTGRVARGASTITMQTVKNIFLSHEKSAERKLQELFLTYWMTRAVPKERILDVYLNIIELCPNCNGAEEGSQFHFDTSIEDLEIRPSVWLSSISPNPTALGGKSPKKDVPKGTCTRCDRILRGLHAREWISDAEYASATPPPTASAEEPAVDDADTRPSFLRPEGDSDASLFPDDTTAPDDALTHGFSHFNPSSASPLTDALDAEDGASPDMEQLSVDERLDAWIDSSRKTRGTH